MIKRKLLVILLIIKISQIWTEVSNPFYYPPQQDEINDYFAFNNYLINCENNDAELTYEWIEKYYDYFIAKESMHSLMFESFLLQTKNEKIRNLIIKYISNENIETEFTKAILRKYDSKEVIVPFEDKTRIQNNYNDEYYDENINLFNLREINCFDEKLGILVPDNEWVMLTYETEETKLNENDLLLMYGGGTNHLSVNISQFTNTEFEEFMKQEITEDYNKNMYKDWQTQEIQPVNILSRSGADRIYISMGTGEEKLTNEIENGTFKIFLYNTDLKEGYYLSYFINFSTINNNYEIRHRIWNQLLMILNFTYIIQK